MWTRSLLSVHKQGRLSGSRSQNSFRAAMWSEFNCAEGWGSLVGSAMGGDLWLAVQWRRSLLGSTVGVGNAVGGHWQAVQWGGGMSSGQWHRAVPFYTGTSAASVVGSTVGGVAGSWCHEGGRQYQKIGNSKNRNSVFFFPPKTCIVDKF